MSPPLVGFNYVQLPQYLVRHHQSVYLSLPRLLCCTPPTHLATLPWLTVDLNCPWSLHDLSRPVFHLYLVDGLELLWLGLCLFMGLHFGRVLGREGGLF